MNLLMLSTRHTKIGTLRRDLVYRIDEENPDVAKVVKNIIDNKAGEKISDAAVKKRNKDVTSLEVSEVRSFTAAEFDEALTSATAERDEALAEVETLKARIAELEKANPKADGK